MNGPAAANRICIFEKADCAGNDRYFRRLWNVDLFCAIDEHRQAQNGRKLNGMSLYSWSVSLPALTSAFATLIFGKFSDMYGRRLILMIALSFTLLGSILRAISTNFPFLIVASVIAAIGSGSLMPLVFAVVGDMFAPAEHGK
jgi:MFS family permease